jgi:hypothetical protein
MAMTDPQALRALADRLKLHAFELVNGGANAGQLRDDLNSAADALLAQAPETSGKADLLEALKDAAQTARNYYMLFHDETWKARLEKWDAVIAKALV